MYKKKKRNAVVRFSKSIPRALEIRSNYTQHTSVKGYTLARIFLIAFKRARASPPAPRAACRSNGEEAIPSSRLVMACARQNYAPNHHASKMHTS